LVVVVDGLLLVPCEVDNGVDDCGGPDGDDGGWRECAAVRWMAIETDKGEEEGDVVEVLVVVVVVWVWDALFIDDQPLSLLSRGLFEEGRGYVTSTCWRFILHPLLPLLPCPDSSSLLLSPVQMISFPPAP
jgi:hypothetical protein